MANKITDFIAQTKSRGMMRSNRYEVVVPFPSKDSNTMKLATLFCDSLSLPGINVASTPARVFGEGREMPYERTYEPIQLSFYCDSNLEIKKAFESWIDLIINPQTRAIQYYNTYIKDIQIYVQTVEDNTTYSVTLYEAYPKSIQAIQMSYDSKEVMKVNVTMQYKYWKSSNTNVNGQSNNLRFNNSYSFDSFGTFQSGDPVGISTGTGARQSIIYDNSVPAMDFGWMKK